MRNIVLALALLMCIPPLCQLNAQTINNGDFEDWTEFSGFRDPTGWDTPNSGLSLFGISSVFREESFVSSGLYSTKLVTTTVPLAGINAPAALTTGTLALNISDPLSSNVFGGAPVFGKPDALTGWYDYDPVGGDSLTIRVFMLNIDGTDTTNIAQEEFFTDVPTGGTWTQFNIPINYTTTDDPELIQILVRSTRASGAANDGTTLYVDEFKLTGITSVEELDAIGIGVDLYPQSSQQPVQYAQPHQ